MNLLDKYIMEVGKHLPQKNRLDLQTEIRSTIEDMFEDRSRQIGKPVDDAMINEVLLEYGAPAKVAAAYSPARYLIGPRLYPFFEMVVKIVFSVLVVIALVGLGVNIVSGSTTGPTFINSLGEFGLQLATGLISAFGNIVLVFAILERVLPASEIEQESTEWSPADLNAEPDPDEIKRVELIFEILFTMLGLALVNLYPSVIGFAMVKDNTWIHIPALSDAFFRYLPWINLLGLLQIALDVYLLRQGIWQMTTRLFGLAVEIAGIVLAGTMLVGPSLINVNAEKMAELLGESSVIILQLLNTIPLIVLVIVIIVQSIEVLKTILRLVNMRKVTPAFLQK